MESPYPNLEQATAAIGPVIWIVVTVFVLFSLVALLVITAVVYCRIFHKAGYHWALGLLMLVPIVCIIMPFVLAFGEWPIHKELQRLRSRQEDAST
ncbi:MAG: hypothetical protein NTX52_05055 [Planctomycetota bacterium]|jgi:uncharacterized membrane protein YhaH (DUF805 family)|nr:hypothetical protein [Planctomycetota bacterium]